LIDNGQQWQKVCYQKQHVIDLGQTLNGLKMDRATWSQAAHAPRTTLIMMHGASSMKIEAAAACCFGLRKHVLFLQSRDYLHCPTENAATHTPMAWPRDGTINKQAALPN